MASHDKTYDVNGTGFNRFSLAVRHAQELGLDVVQTSNGQRRWTPGKISKAAQDRYEERLAVWEAQERAAARRAAR